MTDDTNNTSSRAQTGTDNAASTAPGDEDAALEGWIPSLASDDEVRTALEKAFEYRGDITLTLKDGSNIEGYVFDRRVNGTRLCDCAVRLFPKQGDEKITVRFDEIARLTFSGRDCAAGKSFEAWVRRYKEKKAAEARATPTDENQSPGEPVKTSS